MFLIQGIFFTQDSRLGIANDPEIGPRVSIEPVIIRCMYGGLLKVPDLLDSSTPYGEGALHDQYGNSLLTAVELTEERLRFYKQYDNRSDSITYDFHKEGNIWIGSYGGSMVGVGASRCILTPMEKEFWHPKGLEEFFKKDPNELPF